jgi:hypothetical protein
VKCETCSINNLVYKNLKLKKRERKERAPLLKELLILTITCHRLAVVR